MINEIGRDYEEKWLMILEEYDKNKDGKVQKKFISYFLVDF